MTQDVQAAKAELDRLRTEQHEAVSQSPTTGSTIGSTPQAPAMPKAVSQSPTTGSAVSSTPQAPTTPKAVSQSPTTGSAVGSKPQAPATATAVSEPSTPAKVTATATNTQESDLFIDARRRFRKIDQNRDDKIDRLDLRLKKVSFLSLIDVNRDGYLTIDETLLSPDIFKRFDPDGDGKISSFEFVDAPAFTAIDANRDEFITFEEYLQFLRISTQ